MLQKIKNEAIKISLIQTLPGEEIKIAHDLKKACDEYGIKRRAILKGFGSFDIIFIYPAEGYASVLTEAGPLEGILKTSRSFAFVYESESGQDFFSAIDPDPCGAYVGISFIKLNQRNSQNGNDIEHEVIQALSEQLCPQKSFFLGTLGWNEFIILTAGDDLNQIAESFFWSTNSEVANKISKTFSVLCLSYKKLPEQEQMIDSARLLEQLNKSPTLNHEILDSLTPSISIAATPKHTYRITSHWERKNYTVSSLVGKDDILLQPPSKITWSVFLSDLLNFRTEFKDTILSTSTNFSLKNITSIDHTEGTSDDSIRPECNYKFSELESIFNEQSRPLAGALNTYRGLLRNNIIGDSFEDMAHYPQYILNTGKRCQSAIDSLNLAIRTADLLKRGAELRLYGTHGTIDESVGQFTKLRGGVQRSLLAVDYLPRSVLNRTFPEGAQWQGFIITASQQFSNHNDVINVPHDALFNPGLWWGLYHESAHIFIDYLKDFIGEQVPEMRLFLSDKKIPQGWMDLVTELSAEYIGFMFGFYGDYDLFVERIWTYLKGLSRTQGHLSPLAMYAIRTFFVGIIDRHLNGDVTKEQLFDLDYMYGEIINHIDQIEAVPGDNDSEEFKKLIKEKRFTAAYYAPRFKELYPWLENKLFDITDRLSLRRDVAELVHPNTSQVLNSILDGEAWGNDIIYPEAVLYGLFKKNSLEFNQSIATILTFWNKGRRDYWGGHDA